MRKLVMTILSLYAVLMPATGLAASSLVATRAASSRGLATTTTRKLTGVSAFAGQVRHRPGRRDLHDESRCFEAAVVKYTDLGGQYSYHTGRSQFLMSQALPLLRSEFLKAQNANIQLVSGATLTSQAFEQSLQSALHKVSK